MGKKIEKIGVTNSYREDFRYSKRSLVWSSQIKSEQVNREVNVSGFGFGPTSSGDDFTTKAAMLSVEALRQSSRKFLSDSSTSDLPVGKVDLEAISQALNIANTWLDSATIFPATDQGTDIAWTRRQWLDASIPGWQKMVEPLADGMAGALGAVVTDMGVQGFLPIMRGFMGSLIATQLGQSIGALAMKVTGSNDVALPLFDNYGAHLVPQNIAQWGEGIDVPAQEIAIFLALREAASSRLFIHTPWLSEYIQRAMTEYGKGIKIDVASIQSQAERAMNSGELDINNPESINIAINQGMFMPEQSVEQGLALEKLEMALALIEGWIDHVVGVAANDLLPSLSALQETLRRARVTNSPTQQLFATLLGLEVSPRKMRECAKFWSELFLIGGVQLRDHRWEDSSLLPTSDDLGDAEKFLRSTTVPDDLSGLL